MVLRHISVAELRKHLLRNILTVFAIAIGVAVFSAVRLASSSLQKSLSDTIDEIAGNAVLQVTAVAGGLPEEIVDAVRSTDGVSAAAPIVESVVRTANTAEGNMLILGVDLAGDSYLRDYTLEGEEDPESDPLSLLAEPEAILVSKEFAARNHLQDDDPLTILTAVGERTVTIKGMMRPRGLAKAFGGNIGVMDIYSAQTLFDRGQTFDRVDVKLNGGASIDNVANRLEAKLGPGFRVEPPLRRGRQTESLMQAYSRVLFLCSLLALLIAVFLIFNAFSVSVAQRRVQIGILRVLGESRSSIQGMFLGEGLVLGALGSAAGALGGVWLGRIAMRFMATVIEQTYGVHLRIDRLRLDGLWTFIAIILGITASMAGALIPARGAGRVNPALVLQKGKYQMLFSGENRLRRRVGVVLAIACLVAGFSPWAQSVWAQSTVFSVLFLSLAMLLPTFSHLLAQVLRRPLGRLFGPEGRLASDSLVQAPRRTSATVAALTFSFACVLVMATFTVSMKASFTEWMRSVFNPDLYISASENLTARTFQFPESVGEQLKNVPGVRQVDSLRALNIAYQDKTPLLLSIELDQWLRRSKPLLEEGRTEDLIPSMAGKSGVLISSNFAHIFHTSKGRTIVLDTPAGRHAFEIAGVQIDYTSESGSLLMDRETYKRLWKDNRVDAYQLMIEPGSDPLTVRREIQRHFAGSRNMLVLTNEELRSEANRLIDQFLKLQHALMVIAVLVAVLGIINSLMVSIMERKREIGVLRGLGGERRQVRKAIMLEAVCIGLVGAVLGIGAGSILGYYSVASLNAAFVGWVFPYRFPMAWALLLVPAAVILSLVAAWYPCRTAMRVPIVEALAYE